MYIYIYAQRLGKAQALQSRGSHSQSNVVATLHSIGKINKGIREYEKPTPVKLLHSIGKINKGIREYENPTPVKLYIKKAKVLGNIKSHPR